MAITMIPDLPLNVEYAGYIDDAENATLAAGNGPARYGRTKNYALLKAAAKIGMLYMKAGTPTEEPIAPGAFCIDTTNSLLYVCTDRSNPTWTQCKEQ